MPYSTDAALRQIVERSKQIRHRKTGRVIGTLSVLCLAQAVLIMGLLSVLSTATAPAKSGVAYGAYLLPSEAGGYILMGVVAFTAGVGLTLACLQARKKSHNRGLYGSGLVAGPIDDVEKDCDHV